MRIRLAGICNTDLEMVRGYRPFRGVLGHEFVGDVVKAPNPDWLGRRVCGEINVWCGQCAQCRAGRVTHCDQRTVLGIQGRDGAFADFLTLPIRNLHIVPQGVADDEAVFVEPLAAAFQILEQVPVSASDTAVVLGDGKLGNLCAQVLTMTGCALIVAGKHPEKLKLLAARGIETATYDSPLPRADVVVEATGSSAGLGRAIELARPRGVVVMKSTVAGESCLALAPAVVKELTLVGSRCGPFPRALDALARGLVEMKPLISDRFPLERGLEALQRAAEPAVMKVLLEP